MWELLVARLLLRIVSAKQHVILVRICSFYWNFLSRVSGPQQKESSLILATGLLRKWVIR